ncbi:MAG: copper homeostasis protein CutC [Aureliella sp.]
MESCSFQLEVCVDRIDEAVAAASAGATRIEFNQALKLDGLTPALSSCSWLSDHVEVPVIAMVRPHNDGFHYTDGEKRCMLHDVEAMLSTGIRGVAIGAFADGKSTHPSLDFEFLQSVCELSGDREVVLHRVFDGLDDAQQISSLETLRQIGVCRILTSGGRKTAAEGMQQLARLVEAAPDGLEILAGSGVNASVLEQLYHQARIEQFHGSFTLGSGILQAREVAMARRILLGLAP